MGKKGASSKEHEKTKSLKVTKKAGKKEKPKKDPNQPKRPATAFFIFLEEFRKTYKRDHPDTKGVAVVGKAGGDKWKEMTEEEKAPYLSKAAKRKADYTKDLAAYNKKKDDDEEAEDASVEESDDKSKSEINDDEDADEDLDDEDD